MTTEPFYESDDDRQEEPANDAVLNVDEVEPGDEPYCFECGSYDLELVEEEDTVRCRSCGAIVSAP